MSCPVRGDTGASEDARISGRASASPVGSAVPPSDEKSSTASPSCSGVLPSYRLRLDPPSGALTVAAFGDRAIAVAAEHADRMVLDLVSPELAREYRAKLSAFAKRAGRPAPSLAAWIPAAVDPDPESYPQIMQTLVGYLEVAGVRRDVHRRRVRRGCRAGPRGRQSRRTAERTAAGGGSHGRARWPCRHNGRAPGGLRRRARRGGARPGHRRGPRLGA